MLLAAADLDGVVLPYHKETLPRGFFTSLEVVPGTAVVPMGLAVTASQDRRIKVNCKLVSE